MDCYETARPYSVLRKQFDDRPMASHQLVQEKLAGMITEITKAQLLALHVGRLKDQGKLDPAHVSMLKRNNVGHRAGVCPAEPRSAGRQRHYGRVPDHAAPVQPGDGEDVRGHRSHSRLVIGETRHGHCGLQIGTVLYLI